MSDVTFEVDENYKLIPLNKIKPNKYNNNVMSKEKFDILVENIKTYGFDEPIILTYLSHGNYEIVDGEHRYKAVKKLGYKYIPAKIKQLNELQRKLLTLSYNKLRGSDNPEKTKKLLRDIRNNYDITEDEIVEVTGYSPLELRLYLTEPREEISLNFELEKQFYNTDLIQIEIDKDNRKYNEGDIWKLGKNYLLCYNSANETHIEEISNIIPKANLILIDIPVDLIENIKENQITVYIKGILDYLTRLVKKKNNFLLLTSHNIINKSSGHKSTYSYYLIEYLKKFYKYKNSIIIIEDNGKQFGELSNGFFTIDVFQYRDSPIYTIQTIYNDNDMNILLQEKHKNMRDNKGFKPLFNVLKSTNEVNRSHNKALINTFTIENDIVLEFYAKNCNNLLACENTKRKYIGIVKSQKDLKKMIGFWEDYTKNQAEYYGKGEINDRN
jgi:ParB/RepB/Spo0J family partition protein